MKAIIYYRKSTDRDDKQANSLEHQLSNCRETASKNSLDIFKEIWESKSAKNEWTRTWFNEMVSFCKAWKVDYIIIDEPKRLSRNNLDTAIIIDLMDKTKIKWILATSREYRADNSRDKFLLQLDLSLSKMDNEDRANDTKAKMLTCIKNTGRFLAKAPFWYDNITIKKWVKDIVLNKLESKVVREIFELRIEWKAYSTIALMIKKRYRKRINLSYHASRIQNIIKNKFYYWVFLWNWEINIWKHPQIISKEMYDKANWLIKKGTHQKTETIKQRKHQTYYLKWFVKDSTWKSLTAYTKKDNVYYMTHSKSDVTLNVSESILFNKIWEIIQKSEPNNKVWERTDKNLILQEIQNQKLDTQSQLVNIESKLLLLENRKEKLLDLQLDWKIEYDIFLVKNNKIIDEIKELEEQKEYLKNDDFEKKAQLMFELAWSLYTSYFRSNNEWKAFIIKKLGIELFVSTKKELQIAETPLLKCSKMLNLSFGIPERLDIRTYLKYLSMIEFNWVEELFLFNKNIIKQKIR